MKIIFTFFSAMFSIASFSQPAIVWQKSLGGLGDDWAQSIAETKDGGYIIAGVSASDDGDITGHHGAAMIDDCWVVKLDGTGSLQWQHSLGGTGNDGAYSIRQTSDDGFIMAGYSYSNDGDVAGHHGTTGYPDCWLVKLDSSGVVQWQQSLGGTLWEKALAVEQTMDGGYVLAGESFSDDGDITSHHGSTAYSDGWVVKLDENGVIVWQKSLGGSSHDAIYSIYQTNDGGYVVAGYTSSADGDVTGLQGEDDYWVAKLDGSGTIEWQQALGGTFSERARSVTQAADGGYVIAGWSRSVDGAVTGNSDFEWSSFWIVKLDNIGGLQWQQSYGGSYIDEAQSVYQTTDGGYIVAGWSKSSDGDVTNSHGSIYHDYWVIQLDTQGNLQWQKSLGGSLDDGANCLLQTTDGGYIVAGFSESVDSDVTGNHGIGDYWIVKLAAFTGMEPVKNLQDVISIYPNPVSSLLQVHLPSSLPGELSMMNSLGQLVDVSFPAASLVTIDVSGLTTGLYFLRWTDGVHSKTGIVSVAR